MRNFYPKPASLLALGLIALMAQGLANHLNAQNPQRLARQTTLEGPAQTTVGWWDYRYNTNCDTAEASFYDASQGATLARQRYYTYNAQGQLATLQTNLRPGPGQDLQPFEREDRFYDLYGDLTTRLTARWNTTRNTWDTLAREHFVHDRQGRILSIVQSLWIGGPSPWRADGRINYDYTALDSLREVRTLVWDTTNRTYVTVQVDTFRYEVLGDSTRTIQTQQVWDGASISRINRHSTTYANDGRPLQTLEEQYIYNTPTPSWDTVGRTRTTYNANSLPLQRAEESYTNGTWAPRTTTAYTYQTCQELLLSRANAAAAGLQLVPNPSTGPVQLALPAAWAVASWVLVGPTGQTLAHGQAQQGQPLLALPALPAGLYHLRVVGPGGQLATLPLLRR